MQHLIRFGRTQNSRLGAILACLPLASVISGCAPNASTEHYTTEETCPNLLAYKSGLPIDLIHGRADPVRDADGNILRKDLYLIITPTGDLQPYGVPHDAQFDNILEAVSRSERFNGMQVEQTFMGSVKGIQFFLSNKKADRLCAEQGNKAYQYSRTYNNRILQYLRQSRSS